MATGFISEDSELFDELTEIFPNRIVPLKSPIAVKGKGRDNEPIELYEVDLIQLSKNQIVLVQERFRKMGLKDPEQFLKEGYRIQTKHFSGVAFDARFLL